jgi:aspartate-semialdehyde dehydrogenase
MKNVKEVAILGATGVVGQKAIALLQNDPQFRIVELASSENSAGHLYGQRVNWIEYSELNEEIANLKLKSLKDVSAPYVISALPSDVAKEVELQLAQNGQYVFSNASAYRMDKTVPLVIPEINRSHLELMQDQKTSGKIITNSNCSTAFLVLGLHALRGLGRFEHLDVVTLQSVSGAGSSLAAFDINANTIPFINGEEEKIQAETKRILGTKTKPLEVDMLVHVNRVPVLFGHTINCHIEFDNKVSAADVENSFHEFNKKFPGIFKIYQNPVLPQPVKNLSHYDMSAHIGRIKSSSNLKRVGFTIMGHNLVRGAAGAAIANMKETINFLEL